MGEVYLAQDVQLHRKVALKVLPTEVAANQDRMRRFKQEAMAAAALMLLSAQLSLASAPGVDLYRDGKFEDAYAKFQQTLKEHPQSRADERGLERLDRCPQPAGTRLRRGEARRSARAGRDHGDRCQIVGTRRHLPVGAAPPGPLKIDRREAA